MWWLHPEELPDHWKYWVSRFWWLRGVAAAFALTSLVPLLFDFSRYELLRALHAIIVGWNIALTKIGQFIGKFPFIPELSSDVMNTIIFISSVTLPLFFSFLRTYISLLYSLFLAFFVTYTYHHTITAEESDILVWIFFIEISLTVILATFVLPSFGKGIIYVLTFIVTLEILYILSSPWLAEPINAFACEVLSIPAEDCAE